MCNVHNYRNTLRDDHHLLLRACAAAGRRFGAASSKTRRAPGFSGPGPWRLHHRSGYPPSFAHRTAGLTHKHLTSNVPNMPHDCILCNPLCSQVIWARKRDAGYACGYITQMIWMQCHNIQLYYTLLQSTCKYCLTLSEMWVLLTFIAQPTTGMSNVDHFRFICLC